MKGFGQSAMESAKSYGEAGWNSSKKGGENLI